MSSPGEDPPPKGPTPPRVPPSRPGPIGGKRDSNRRRRIRELHDAGLRLFLKRGIVAVTIDEIVREAGMAKASFYRYLKDKEELVATIIATIRTPVEAALDACEAALAEATSHEAMFLAYQALGLRLAQMIRDHGDVVLLYLQQARAPGVGARSAVAELAQLIDERAVFLTEAARKHGLWRPFDARISSMVVVGAAEKLLFASLTGQDVGERHKIPAALASLVLDGLRNPA